MKRPEQALQQQVAQFLDAALPDDAWWTAIPLGGGGRLRGAILKGMGAKAGTPDLLIVYRGRAFWIELKAATGRLTPAQKVTHLRLTLAGCLVDTCRSVEEVAGVLGQVIPLRARISA